MKQGFAAAKRVPSRYVGRVFLAKKRKQAAFVASVAARGLSQEQAVEEARFIPLSIIEQCRVVRWVR